MGSGIVPFGDRRISIALRGVPEFDDIDAGVVSWGLLDFCESMRGAGEPLRSAVGHFGGTAGGRS